MKNEKEKKKMSREPKSSKMSQNQTLGACSQLFFAKHWERSRFPRLAIKGAFVYINPLYRSQKSRTIQTSSVKT